MIRAKRVDDVIFPFASTMSRTK